jgi:hypothetical protein
MKDGETKVDGEDEIVELDEPINPFMEQLVVSGNA